MMLHVTSGNKASPRRELCLIFEPPAQHRVAAVLAIDTVGYTRLMGLDEARTHARYKSHRRELIDIEVAEHCGRIVKSTGDGVLAEFASARDAVLCAVDIQGAMAHRNAGEPRDQRIAFRIGLSHGRIIVESDDIYGDEVNVAARLQAVAPPGGIAMSAKVVELTHYGVRLPLEDLGALQLRNMDRAIHVFRYHGPVH